MLPQRGTIMTSLVVVLLMAAAVQTAAARKYIGFDPKVLRAEAAAFDPVAKRAEVLARFEAADAACEAQTTRYAEVDADSDEAAVVEAARLAYEECAKGRAQAYAAGLRDYTTRVATLQQALREKALSADEVCPESVTVMLALVERGIPFFGSVIDRRVENKYFEKVWELASQLQRLFVGFGVLMNSYTCIDRIDVVPLTHALDRVNLMYFDALMVAEMAETEYLELFSEGIGAREFGDFTDHLESILSSRRDKVEERRYVPGGWTPEEEALYKLLSATINRPYSELVDDELQQQETFQRLALDLEEAMKRRIKEQAERDAADTMAKERAQLEAEEAAIAHDDL